MAKDIQVKEEKIEEDNRVMEQQENDSGSYVFIVPHYGRNVLGWIKSISKNNEAVEELKAFPNNKK